MAADGKAGSKLSRANKFYKFGKVGFKNSFLLWFNGEMAKV